MSILGFPILCDLPINHYLQILDQPTNHHFINPPPISMLEADRSAGIPQVGGIGRQASPIWTSGGHLHGRRCSQNSIDGRGIAVYMAIYGHDLDLDLLASCRQSGGRRHRPLGLSNRRLSADGHFTSPHAASPHIATGAPH